MATRYMIDPTTYSQLHWYCRREVVPPPGDLSTEEWASDIPPKDPFLLLLPDTIKGYNMQDKKWGLKCPSLL
jgi:hypothetical protein